MTGVGAILASLGENLCDLRDAAFALGGLAYVVSRIGASDSVGVCTTAADATPGRSSRCRTTLYPASQQPVTLLLRETSSVTIAHQRTQRTFTALTVAGSVLPSVGDGHGDQESLVSTPALRIQRALSLAGPRDSKVPRMPRSRRALAIVSLVRVRARLPEETTNSGPKRMQTLRLSQ